MTAASESLFSYLNLDRFFGAIWGYASYRAAVTRCFFSAPRLGHDYDGGGLVQHCTRCPKVWVGNL